MSNNTKQPTAMSALTDEQIDAAADAYKSGKTASPFAGVDFRCGAEFARAALAAEAAPAAQAPRWLPIETAPKDMGSYLFLCNGVAIQGFKDATDQLCVCLEAGAAGNPPWRVMRRKPTHWMPLPATPQSAKERP